MFTMTRIGYCEECAKAHRPKSEDYYIAHGFTSKKMKVKDAEHIGIKFGYTPHIYRIVEIKYKVVFYKMICGMNKCGSYFYEKDGKNFLALDPNKWSETKVMGGRDWIALMKFKDTGFEI